MPASHPRLRVVAVGISLFALVAIAAGSTLAASTNPPTLYACYNAYGQVAMGDVNTVQARRRWPARELEHRRHPGTHGPHRSDGPGWTDRCHGLLGWVAVGTSVV